MNSTKNGGHFHRRCAAILALIAVLLVPVYQHHLVNEQVTSRLEPMSNLNTWKFWNLALSFQLIHAAVLYFLVGRARKDVWWALFAGIVGFSGGIYLSTMTQMESFSALSQIGLLTLMVAWGVLVFRGSPAI